jgi:hypothetical protein
MTLLRRNHGRNHSYWADGIKLPGVTTILQQAPKPALVEWAGNVTAEYALDHWDELGELKPSARLARLRRARFEDRDTAARRGTQVHGLAEHLAAGREVEVPEALAGHVESYVKFLDRFDPDPIAIELVVANREVGYCGTADLVAHMLGAVWLIDIKTSRSGIFPETALQVCAYARAETYTTAGRDGAEDPLAGLGIERCAALHVRGDGYDLRPVETDADVWDTFQHLAWLHHHKDEPASWVGDAIEPLRVA